jgi:hypothetical protein
MKKKTPTGSRTYIMGAEVKKLIASSIELKYKDLMNTKGKFALCSNIFVFKR